MNYDPINNFLDRARKMSKSSKELRLTYEETNTLAINLAQLLAELKQKGDSSTTSVVLDGGSF